MVLRTRVTTREHPMRNTISAAVIAAGIALAASAWSSMAATTIDLQSASGIDDKFLADGQGRAMYLFEADKGSTSTCTGACAAAWPPVTASAMPMAGSGVDQSLLGTTK